jgi:DNA-binding GntR family transcriptional regulator
MNKLDYKRDFPQLMSRLETLIIIGAFLPKERLVEADLAKKMEVSRAWIRDALKILETKGLVKMIPYRGAIVADLTEKEVEEIFQVRVVLERLCNKLAADNFLPEHKMILQDLAGRIKHAYGEDRFDKMIAANTNFMITSHKFPKMIT